MRLAAVPILVALALSGCAATLSHIDVDKSQVEMDSLAESDNLDADVASLAKPLVDSDETPGIIVGVLTADGSMHFYAYGYADKATLTPLTPDTIVPVGSLTKGFVGAIMDNLVRQGVFSWDDTLKTLLPGVPMSRDAGKITLREMATHTAGFPRQPMTPELLFSFIHYEFTGENFYRAFDTPYMLKYLDDFDSSPTMEPVYSNIGYALMGYIIEQRTGRSLEALLQQMLTSPLGMRQTGFELDALPGHDQRAVGYAGDHPLFLRRGTPTPDFHLTHIMQATGGLYSTARDMLTFAAACLRDDGSPLSKLLDDTMRVRVPEVRGATGIAWFVDHVDGEVITYQEGLIGGFSNYLGLDRTHHTAVVVFRNSFNWDFPVGHRLLIRMAKAAKIDGHLVITGIEKDTRKKKDN